MARTGKPSPFTINGGRAGNIAYQEGALAAQLEWEMLVGDVAMVIYAWGCSWSRPQARLMERTELLELVQRLADALPAPVEVRFADGSVVIAPRE